MRNVLLLSSLLGAAGANAGVLAPDTQAPLFAHLREVNAQWSVQDPSPEQGDHIVVFTDEAHRIATHLERVRKELLARHSTGITAEQAARRRALLERLGLYANGRTFPKNHVLSYRNPVFIDPYGTACAVGWLMIESGHRDLAERISHEMNLGYVHEIIADPRFSGPVAEWASTHGFTADELAWIQPAYPPSTPWVPFGGGTNGPVHVLLDLGAGQVLVAGTFTTAGGNNATHVALWDGTTLQPMGAGLNGEPECAIKVGGVIHVGGSFQNETADLAIWNGTTWNYEMVFPGMAPRIHDLHLHEGQLFAAGEASGFAGTDHRVMVRDAGTWSFVGEEFNDAVLALESHDGVLVAGGAFTQTVSVTDPLALHVARLSGSSWTQLGDGLDATVRDLLSVAGVLHAAGDLFANIAVTFGLARINGGSDTWEHLLPEHANYMTSDLGPSYINDMAYHDGTIYLAGRFNVFTLMVVGNHVASFNGEPDGIEPLAALDLPVNAVTVSNSRLIIGGDFNVALPYLAAVDIGTGMAPITMSEDLLLYPVPARDQLFIELPDPQVANDQVRVMDAEGRAVPVRLHRQNGRTVVDVRPLAPGIYTVHVEGNGRSGRFVRE